ncbi:MAG: 16S rRNA (uracil(1498)-N(3))-methyltransferase [Fimbriimonas sp.]|nr:16S rRNA (uracil(1498)-N(3))-methyltransferase [Fimbriimonas sp.]
MSIRALPRIFISGADMAAPFEIPRAEFDKLHNVLRLRSGARIGVLPNDGSFWECELDGRYAKPLEKHLPNTEPSLHITIAQALPKGDKLDDVVRACTELGVSHFIVFPSDRSIVKWEDRKLNDKMRRLESLSKEAAETAFRTKIPLVEYRQTLADVMREPNLIALSESEKEFKQLSTSNLEPLTLAVGPEGGWSPREVELLKPYAVTLGPRVLRTEHAGFAAAAKLLI